MREIEPTEVGDRLLLDVREPHEWTEVRAPGATHLPMGQVPSRLAELPTDAPIAVVCHLGGRSARVTEWLGAQGYDVVNVAGGMDRLEQLGLPVERG